MQDLNDIQKVCFACLAHGQALEARARGRRLTHHLAINVVAAAGDALEGAHVVQVHEQAGGCPHSRAVRCQQQKRHIQKLACFHGYWSGCTGRSRCSARRCRRSEGYKKKPPLVRLPYMHCAHLLGSEAAARYPQRPVEFSSGAKRLDLRSYVPSAPPRGKRRATGRILLQ